MNISQRAFKVNTAVNDKPNANTIVISGFLMIMRTSKKNISPPIPVYLGATPFVIFAFAWVKSPLDISFAASKHLVDYVTDQTGFNGAKLKEYNAAMQQADTLDVY